MFPPLPKIQLRERRDKSILRHWRRRISDFQPLLYPLAGLIILAWRRSLRLGVRYDRRGPLFDFLRERKPYVFTSWHQDIFVAYFDLTWGFPNWPPLVMASPGRTGDIGSYLLRMFGAKPIAGSGSAHGQRAIESLTRRLRMEPRPVYIMADGSRGPDKEARWGALNVARDTGLPIIAGRAWSRSVVCLNWTWMRLALPLPWGRTVILTSEPLYVPADTPREGMQAYREELQRRLDALNQASLEYFEKGPDAVNAFGPAQSGAPIPPAVTPAAVTD